LNLHHSGNENVSRPIASFLSSRDLMDCTIAWYLVRTRIAGQVRVCAMQSGQTRSCGSRRIAGQVRVRAMQAGQTRSCGARAHTHKHPRTETPAVVSHATCAAALPSGSPLVLSTQFQTVENCQQSNPTNFGLVFRSPPTLRVFGDLMSNISATRGRPDMRFCVCGSPRGDLSHIASVTLGCSRSDFSGAN
jgi:hypothetical protein